jgi:Ca2+-binding RTX toxin-like protein
MRMLYYEPSGPGIAVGRTSDSGVDVAYLSSGRFVMVWTDYDQGLGDTTGAIRARLYEADGTPLGEEFRVNSSTSGTQQVAKVAALSSGGFVVTWNDFSGQGGDSGESVKAQIYSSDAVAVGGELLVNTTTASAQRGAAVTGMADGSFVVTWDDLSRTGGDTSSWAIRGQRFDVLGAKLGSEFLVNTTTAGFQIDSSVAAQADGSFMVVWLDLGAGGYSSDGEIRAQTFNADGLKSGAELLLSSRSLYYDANASVTSLIGGGYLVLWQAGSIGSQKIYAQRFDAAGQKIGDVAAISSGGQFHAQAAALPDGGFVVSWSSYGYDGVGRSVAVRQAQVFDEAAAPQGAPMTLAVGGEDPTSPGHYIPIAADAQGGFIAAWSIGGGRIDARRYAPGEGEVGPLDLSNRTASEALPENSVIGRLWNGGVANLKVVYSIESDSSGGGFRIDGDLLVLEDLSRIDFETGPTVTLTVRATAANGSSTVQTFDVAIGDSPFEENYGGSAEIAVNSATAGAQTSSSVTALAGGGFLITWSDTPVLYGDSNVKGQLYDASGAMSGTEFLISGTTAPLQHSVFTAGLQGGGFVAVWFDGNAEGPGSGAGGVKAQLFDAAGARVGGEFLVNTATANAQVPTAVTALASGGFVVAWTDSSLQGGDAAIGSAKAQVFDAAGARVGGEFLLNTTTAGAQTETVLAALPNGGFVAAWVDGSRTGGDTSSKAVRAQLFDASGAKIGPEFLVNTATGNDQHKPAVTVLASGRFVIAWEMAIGEGRDQDGTSVRAQLYGADGVRIGGEMLVNETVRLDQTEPAVTALPNGGFLIVWHSESGDPWYPEINIMGQYYDADGQRAGGEFRVNGDAGRDQVHPSVATLASGGFVVSWTEEEYDMPAEVRARVFTPGAASRTLGTEAGETVAGSAGDDILYALGGGDVLRVDQGGDDTVHGGHGDDVIYFGSRFDADDRVNGGGGYDTLVLQGFYGVLKLVTPIRGIENIRLLSAGNGAFGGAATGPFSYTIAVEGSALTAGTLLSVDASGLSQSEILTFQGSSDGGARYAVTGGKGADQVTGGSADDVLSGGEGDDYIWGRGGADLLSGGEGNDRISGDGGDTVHGGNGNDELTSGPGSWSGLEALYGEGGNDRLSFVSNVGDGSGALLMSGGEGNDQFTVGAQSAVSLTIDAGAGDDSLLFNRLLGAAATVILGSGRDRMTFGPLDQLLNGIGALVVRDFETGPSGETIPLLSMLDGDASSWPIDSNPFVSGYVRLVQDGTDTLLQFDLDGGGNGFVTLIRFRDRDVAGFTPENLDGYVNGTGSAGRVLTSVYHSGFYWEGTNGDDVMTGSSGADRLIGRNGNDVLSGADGNDQIEGHGGADRIDGGGGADQISAYDGHDELRGGDGDDIISAAGAGSKVYGGLGADSIDVSQYHVAQGRGVTTVDAGDGNDTVTIRIDSALDLTVDAGAGADRVQIRNLLGTAAVTLGAGADTLVLGNPATFAASTILPGGLTITDFQPGAVGDRIEFDLYLARNLPNRSAGSNPFETGDLRLVQSGADTLVEIRGSEGAYTTLVKLASLSAAELSAFNLGGYAPSPVLGTAGDDVIVGSAGDDRLVGGSGNDLLDGGVGNDLMRGGAGDDRYVVDAAGDIVEEFAGEGIDEVRTALGSRSDPAQLYVLAAHVENLTGTSAAAQGVRGNALDNVIKMGAGGDLVVLDAGGNDIVAGGGGNDFLYFGAAFTALDSADGGAGSDTVGLLGGYSLTLGAASLLGVETLALYSSGNAAAPNGYALIMHDGNVAAGKKLLVNAQSLLAGETLAFDGAAERDGSFDIRGGRGDDTITGGAGADRIAGNLGADTLRGGAGADIFVYRSTADSTASSRDTILDFARGDVISLGGIDADGDAANGNSKFAFIGAAAFSGTAGELRVFQDPNFARAWFVEGDTNGDTVADFSLVLVAPNAYPLGKDDFFL